MTHFSGYRGNNRHGKPITGINIGKVFITTLFERIQQVNKNVEKKRSIMTDTAFRRLYTSNGDMNRKENRLETYIVGEWGKDVSMREMSAAGFCFTGKGDNVVCFYCKGVLSSWEIGNIPITRHIKAFPHCKFARDTVKKFKHIYKSTLEFDHVTVTTTAVNNDERELEDEIRSISFFSSEYNRLVSFAGWSINHPLKIQELAKAGFYHTDDVSGTVMCFACFGKIKDWKAEEQPMVKHKQFSPSCPFIKGLRTDNTSVTKDELKQVQNVFERLKSQSHLTIPVQCTESLSDDSDIENESQTDINTQITSMSNNRDPMYLSAQHKEYFRENTRMESFSNWPKDHFIQPIELVKAGFFKSGKEDQVTCFYCGLNLLGWEPNDNPLKEHTREVPDCKWVEFERSRIRVEKIKQEQYISHDSSVQKEEDNVTASPQDNITIEKEMDQLVTPEMAMGLFDMGFSEEIVKHVLRQRIESGQATYQNTVELLEAVFKEEEERDANKKSKYLVYGNPSLNSGTADNKRCDKEAMDALEEKIDKLEERNTCKICLDEEVIIIFLPCKHLAVCEACAERIESCPICREYIDDKLQIFIP